MNKVISFAKRHWLALGASAFTIGATAACSVPTCGYGPAKCF